MKQLRLLLVLLAFALGLHAQAQAGTQALNMGDACGFALLGGTSIVNNGTTSITGDAGSAVLTDSGSMTVSGNIYATSPELTAAQSSLLTAYNEGLTRTPDNVLSATLGGTIQLPGVYTSVSGAFDISGILTLDGNFDPDAVFIFRTTDALVTAGASSVILSNSATAKNVFWIIGSDATLGGASTFVGSILASGDITVGNVVGMDGRVLAVNGTVTLDTDTIANNEVCIVDTPTPSPTASSTETVTGTATPTPTGTVTGTATATSTEGATGTATPTPTPSDTGTGTATHTPDVTATFTVEGTATSTATPTVGPISPGAVDLGCADGFSILAFSGITNTGDSSADGLVGSFPTTSEDGFETMSEGCADPATSVVEDAKTCLAAAYVDASTRISTDPGIPAELGSSTKFPGVYDSLDTTFEITGTLTLDGNGNTNAVFIFKTGSTLTTASGSDVVLINGAMAKNVFWAIGSSATLGTNSHMVGTILAQESITLNTGATIEGRILARDGAVTMEAGNIVSSSSVLVPCTQATMTPTPDGGSPTVSPSPTNSGTATPTPAGTFTMTPSATGTPTPDGTFTASPTSTLTGTPGASFTVTPTATPTQTPGGSTMTFTPTPDASPVATAGPTDGGSYFYPSPARNGLGAVAYELSEAAEVTLRVYNQTGRLVDTVVENKAVGSHSTAVSVDRFANGTYYYVLTLKKASGVVEVNDPKKFVVLN